jgi:hypothetical protein
VGEIISEWWATSSRNGGRDHLGMAGGITPESASNPPAAAAEGRGCAIGQIPKRDRRMASPLSSTQQPMDQVF